MLRVIHAVQVWEVYFPACWIKMSTRRGLVYLCHRWYLRRILGLAEAKGWGCLLQRCLGSITELGYLLHECDW